jgi:16S rRNA (uracil1498-N3)-methyltransferase
VRVRIYLPEAELGKEEALSSEQIRHLKVLRVKKGELVGIFDGIGNEYEGFYSGKVIVPEKQIDAQKEPDVKVTLAVAVPKGARMDFLIEKVSEIGVNSIVPIICSRGVVKPKGAKIERWRRIVVEACAQSERSMVPTLSNPIPFTELLSTIKQYEKAYICQKGGKVLPANKKGNILLIVGPEGDFTPEEMESALEAGCQKVSLGPTILRTETAGIVAVAQSIGKSL